MTLVEGASFTICGADGGIDGGGVAGLFVGDTRICSRMLLSIDGGGVEPLTLATRSPSSASFVGRTFDKKLLVFRDLWVGQGMRVELRIRNLARESRRATIRISFEADLAELFDVKKGVRSLGEHAVRGRREATSGSRATGGAEGSSSTRRRDAQAEDAWRARVAGRSSPLRETWEACVELRALRGGEEVHPHPSLRPAVRADAVRRRTRWMAK